MQEIRREPESRPPRRGPGPPATGRTNRIRGERPRLTVLCGPSHTGKTTFARRLRGAFTIVSSDEMRRHLTGRSRVHRREARVWKVFESKKRRALRKGHDVVLDACHISERARWHALQGPNARHRKICVVFDLPWRVIRQRCLEERKMPLKEVERMWDAFQRAKPTRRELKRQGFDEVYFVRGCLGSAPTRGR